MENKINTIITDLHKNKKIAKGSYDHSRVETFINHNGTMKEVMTIELKSMENAQYKIFIKIMDKEGRHINKHEYVI